MISRLCLSDLHLGDPRSTLSSPDVADKVVDYLWEISGGEVGTLVLNGDVWEECVPGDPDTLEDGIAASVLHASRHFFTRLFTSVRASRIVYVPGNHDLSLWHWYAQSCRVQDRTSYCGRTIDCAAWPWSALLGTFRGDLVVSYPLFWDRSAGADYPILIFTHGHLLDPLVRGLDSEAEYLALRALGCDRPSLPPDVADIPSVGFVSDAVSPFVLQLWRRYSRIDYSFSNYVMRRLLSPQSCHFSTTLQQNGYHDVTQDMASDAPPSDQGYLSDVSWFLDLVLADPGLPTPVGELGRGAVGPAFSKPSCLVYGHDHLAARRIVNAGGVPFLAVGSGGWTCEHDGHLPHAHVLVWREATDVVPTSYFLKVQTKDAK